jgi:hypothetical protein
MKKIVIVSLMLIAGLLDFTGVPQAEGAAPKSYLMMCRGGGIMSAMASAPRGRATSDRFAITFEKSATAAQSSGPGPGQCAWIDRPLDNNEPAELRYISRDVATVNSWVVTYQNKLNRRGIGSGVRVLSSDAETLINAVRYGDAFYIHVYNSNEGYMRITRVGL